MLSFFKKLMFARQLKMEGGEFKILNENFVIFPTATLAEFVKIVDGKKLYRLVKSSSKMLTHSIGKNFGGIGKISSLGKLMEDMFSMGGWGLLNVIRVDAENDIAIFHLKNSSVAKKCGKSKSPVDHFCRGLLAGGANAIVKKELDCIETRCEACGSSYCEFVVAPIHHIKKVYEKMYKSQI